jgi:branched-chain amino acid transport system substrate-binding protein
MLLVVRVGRNALPLALCIGAVGSLIGCNSKPQPIVIGAAAPWQDQAFSIFGRRGVELAVDEVNAAGGVRGRPLVVRWCDDSATETGAVRVAESLLADPSVVAVVGHMNSTPMLAAVPLYDGHMPVISPWATSPDLTGVSPWVFRNTTSDSVNGVTIADFAVAHLGARRAAVLYENDAYGRGVARAFRREFHGTVVETIPIPGAAPTYEPYIALLKQQQLDVVMFAGLSNSAAALLQEMRHQHLTTTIISNGDLAGLQPDSTIADGAYIPVWFSADDPRPSIRQFSAAFEARYHAPPDEDAALAYDATRLIVAAIRAVGPDRRDIRDYIASLTAAHPYDGITGPEYFLSTGDPLGRQFQMGQMRHGAAVAVAR